MNALQKAGTLTQSDCLEKKDKKGDKYRCPFVTTFKFQHRKISKIMGKYWHILKNDSHLMDSIPKNSPIIYGRARTLKNALAN